MGLTIERIPTFGDNYTYLVICDETHDAAIIDAPEEDPVVARVELPVWVAEDVDRLALVHGAIVKQAHITGEYPYALVRADELAYISGPEREAFEEMVTTALLGAGVTASLSPKRHYKTLTRRGRRKRRR